MARRTLAVLASALGLVCLPLVTTPAFAWGDEGHRAVATIAYSLLSPAAKKEVDALLREDPAPAECGSGSFVDDAVWPDKLRAAPTKCSSGLDWGKTAPWHFVDIPVNAPAYDRARDCPLDDCVVAKIEDFRRVLANNTEPKARRRDALKFLIHFVADLHQPLHTTSAPFNRAKAEYAAEAGARRNVCLVDNLPMDRGGNCVDVREGRRRTELHAFWDTDIVKAMSKDPAVVASIAMQGVGGAQIKAMQAGTIVDWLNEAHRVAVDVVYRELPSGPMPQLSGAYEDEALLPAEVQLRRAGVRLAKVVEDALGEPYEQAPRAARR